MSGLSPVWVFVLSLLARCASIGSTADTAQRVFAITFIACPASEAGCKTPPDVSRFLVQVVGQGQYMGVEAQFVSGTQGTQAVMYNEHDVEVDSLGVDHLVFAELNTLVRSKGFRRRDEKEDVPVLNGINGIQLTTSQGLLRIRLRPDWSKSSVYAVQRLAQRPDQCSRCEFYRAEQGGVLQGCMISQTVAGNNITTPGPRFMERGDIGWAGGEPGPHFFIYLGQGPAKSWGLSHTVWGLLADKDSFEVAEKLVGLPAKAKDPRGWPIMLLKPEPFTMTLHKLPGSQR